ncbi:MAG: glycosyltransferase involved in cell wall biosynthesis [Planctomycetota bacterium]|jgi:glycosyltransferase involved in cell wall biosynthesis
MASGARGGGADHMIGLLPALRKLGIECEAAVGRDGPLFERMEQLEFPAHRIELMESRFHPTAPLRMSKLLRKVRPDIVHYHGTRAAWTGAISRPLHPFGPKAVYTAHGLAYRKEMSRVRTALFRVVEGTACRFAHAVISVSSTDLEDLATQHVLPAVCAHVPNAVDTTRFAAGDRTSARLATGLPENAWIIGTTSRLVPQKSLADMIDAVASCPGVTLVIAGDGELRDELHRRAEPIHERVLFLGSRDDIPELLRAFDIFALSSRWEGEPIALLEAMATALPCLATATAGSAEILRGSGAEVLVDIGDVDALAVAIRELQADPGRLERMGAAGLDAVTQRSYANAAQQVLAVYRKL